MQAATLFAIGAVYDNLGEKNKALKFYNQALPLARKVGDNYGETAILNNIAVVYKSLGKKRAALWNNKRKTHQKDTLL